MRRKTYITGEEIRKRRRSLDVTQDDFAKMLDCDQSHISRWEGGRIIASRRMAKLIRQVLDDLETKLGYAA